MAMLLGAILAAVAVLALVTLATALFAQYPGPPGHPPCRMPCLPDGRHEWRRATFNDSFTNYRDQPGWFCDRCAASVNDDGE